MGTASSSALIPAIAVALVAWTAPEAALGQSDVPGVQRIKQFLTSGPPARRRIDTKAQWNIGAETLFTTNTFLEPDLDGPLVRCLSDGSFQPLTNCAIPPTGPVFEHLPREDDGEPNEAIVVAATSEFNLAYARRNYLLNGGGDVAVFRDSETDQIRVSPSIRLLGRTGLLRDHLTIDASATAQRASISEVNIQSTNPYANIEQRGLFISSVVRPTLVIPLTTTSGASLQYSRRQTWQIDDSDQDEFDTSRRGRQSVNTYSASVYASGFDQQLELSGAVSRSRSEFRQDEESAIGSDSYLQLDTILAEGRLAVTENATLIANGGVDEVASTRPDNRRLDGGFWAVGFSVRGRTFDAEALLGERYNGEYYRAQLNYVLRNFLTLTATATRQLEIQFGSAASANLSSIERTLDFYDTYGRFAFATPVSVDGDFEGYTFPGEGEGLQGSLSPLLDFRDAIDQSSGERGAPGVVDRLQGEARFEVARIGFRLRGGVTAFDFGDVSSQVNTAGFIARRSFTERYGVEIGLSRRWSMREQCILPADVQEFCQVAFSIPDLPIQFQDAFASVPPDELNFSFEDRLTTLQARARLNAQFSSRLNAFLEAGHLDGEQGRSFNGVDAAGEDVSETYVRIGVRWGGRR